MNQVPRIVILRQITQAARNRNAQNAKSHPVKDVPDAHKSQTPILKHPVSSKPTVPARDTSTVRDVVADQLAAAMALLAALQAAAGAVIQELSKASQLAREIADKLAPVVKKLIEVVADLTGITDLVNCVTKGDVAACAWTAANLAAPVIGRGARALRTGEEIAKGADEASVAVRGEAGPVREADNAGSCLSAHSFTADTKVRMADGSTKPISEIRVGDKVLATDPTTGRTAAEPVTALLGDEGDKQLVEVTTDSGKVVATEGHPFWVDSEHRWVQAKDLKPGYRFETADHRSATVTGTRTWSHHLRVYNLTVDRLHTYYVTAGNTDLLVHNDGAGPCAAHPEDGSAGDPAAICTNDGSQCPKKPGPLVSAAAKHPRLTAASEYALKSHSTYTSQLGRFLVFLPPNLQNALGLPGQGVALAWGFAKGLWKTRKLDE